MNKVSLVEVGPRDGLQNVSDILSTEQKIRLIRYLLDHGFQHVEAGSFVRADRVPQMADSEKIADTLKADHNKLWYLAPNQKGLETALAHGATQLAFFTAASPSFNKKNIGMEVQESIDKMLASLEWLKNQGYQLIPNWKDIAKHEKDLKVRVYISTVIGCPYEGLLDPLKVIALLDRLIAEPIAQFSMGDTIGVGTPARWKKLLQEIDSLDSTLIKKDRIALHCHNTYGTALASVATGLDWGVRTFDSSIGGLGGCPFAPGATGNLATEDLLYFLEAEGMQTGIDVKKILDAFCEERTGKLINRSAVACAMKK